MLPWFRTKLQRRLNARLLTLAVNRALGPRIAAERRIVLTTLPITADLIGHLDVDRWLYYCVDDFSAWPGLDNRALDVMERKQLRLVDGVVAASSHLSQRLSDFGRSATVLTHGVDLAHWSSSDATLQQHTVRPSLTRATQRQSSFSGAAKLRAWLSTACRPLVLFWGLIDRRLDVDWCRSLVKGLAPSGTLVLVGPIQSPDPSLRRLDHLVLPGPVSYASLPYLATLADVLVLPYADLPATRAMQPLKFKEYLATGKPVVARSLPATRDWADAADLVATAEEFVAVVQERLRSGLPPAQLEARRRLAGESWESKARALETILASL
jgi:glycosyltransferase involved in cell wall biosynthesis